MGDPAESQDQQSSDNVVREKSSDSPYGLRDTNRLPARFRESGEDESPRGRVSPVKRRVYAFSPKRGTTATTIPHLTDAGAQQRSTPSGVPSTSSGTPQPQLTTAIPSRYASTSTSGIHPTPAPARGSLTSIGAVGTRPIRKVPLPTRTQKVDEDNDDAPINVDDQELSFPLPDPTRLPTTAQPAAPIAHSSVLSTDMIGGRSHTIMMPHPGFHRMVRTRTRAPADLTDSLKDNLRRLKNVLKLPKARRWVYCEFFYSGVDEQLFLGENEFSQLVRESFPNLKTRWLRMPEWRAVRRLIGKPRRFSQAFLEEERVQLEGKRNKIRQIYDGTFLFDGNVDLSDLPTHLPRPLVVGSKIYGRVRDPKDGIYAGTIDAILPDSYRVVFDREEMIPPMVIRDSEVTCEVKQELLSFNYFLEQNRAALPAGVVKLGPTPILPSGKPLVDRSPVRHDMFIGAQGKLQVPQQKKGSARDEKVGNFPVRLLVILVKLSKLIEMKKGLVRQLTNLNVEAEKANLLSDSYHYTFQEKYAQVVLDLEQLNKQMNTYMQGVTEYNSQLLPQLSEVSVTSRPEVLRKMSNTHALQIVKHCNNGFHVTNRRAIDLIKNLTGLLLTVRQLGQQKCTPIDLQSLSESIGEIRRQVLPQNAAAFQDDVEVHMKQIHNMMLQSGAL